MNKPIPKFFNAIVFKLAHITRTDSRKALSLILPVMFTIRNVDS